MQDISPDGTPNGEKNGLGRSCTLGYAGILHVATVLLFLFKSGSVVVQGRVASSSSIFSQLARSKQAEMQNFYFHINLSLSLGIRQTCSKHVLFHSIAF